MEGSGERWRSAWRGVAGTLPANSHKSWLNHARVSIQPKAFSRGFDFIMDIDSVRDYSPCVEASRGAWRRAACTLPRRAGGYAAGGRVAGGGLPRGGRGSGRGLRRFPPHASCQHQEAWARTSATPALTPSHTTAAATLPSHTTAATLPSYTTAATLSTYTTAATLSNHTITATLSSHTTTTLPSHTTTATSPSPPTHHYVEHLSN